MTSQEADVSRLKTFSAMGKELSVLDGGGEAVLLEHEGCGCLTHMWFGGDWPGYERTRLRVRVDGEAVPSIDMELGLGHGCGFGDPAAPWGTARMGKTGHPGGLYNTYRIPFGRSLRITAQRPPECAAEAPFWWILRGTDHLPLRVGGLLLPERARLVLHRLEDHLAQPLEEFALAEASGAGMLYQTTLAAQALRNTGHWSDWSAQEACLRAYLDGAADPAFLSSGLEDYFLGTYYFQRGRYQNALAGLTHWDEAARRFSAYRFHEEDPVFFQRGMRITCRCGEQLGGKVFHDPPPTRYTAYVWAYQW